MFLLAECVYIAERAVRPVILEAHRDAFQQIVAELEFRLELVARILRRPVKGFPESRVEPQVQLAELFIDNRPDLPGPGIAREIRPLIAELGREAQADRQVVPLGNRHPRPDMRAHPLPTAVRLNAGELVEARLKPLVESVRNLHGFVHGVVCGQHSVAGSLRSLRREVAVQLENGDTLRHQFRGVNLHLVIALRAQTGCPAAQENHDCGYLAQNRLALLNSRIDAPYTLEHFTRETRCGCPGSCCYSAPASRLRWAETVAARHWLHRGQNNTPI